MSMPSIKRTKLTGNRILDQLSAEEFNRLAPHLEPVSMKYKETVYRTGDSFAGVIFPVSGMLSLLVVLEEGREVEVAMIGNEGVIGAGAVLGIEESPYRIVVQAEIDGLRLPLAPLRRALERVPRLDTLMRLYLGVSLHSAHRLVACNVLHPVNARLCRWLLMAQDRLGPDCCPLTHEFLAELLGVRRQTVTTAARELQAQDLISYRRGSLRIINRSGLEDAACECYAALRDYEERHLG
jgi:CRP-like cAMP-binding protein